MSTPRLQTTKRARAAEIATENILPMLPDGRFVVVGGRDFYFPTTERCSCFDQRVTYGKWRKAIEAGEIDASTPAPQCKHIIAVVERAH